MHYMISEIIIGLSYSAVAMLQQIKQIACTSQCVNTFKDSSRAVQVSHPRSLINQQWTMKTLLCVAVLALVASTIASPLPHRAAINNHHLLDNNVRELGVMISTKE